MTLFDQAGEIGGQFNMAKVVPGKEEFHNTIRYFSKKLESTGVTMKLNTRVEIADLEAAGFDEIVIATGVLPRTPGIPGVDHPKVLSYVDVLRGKAEVGEKVAVIGAGGIGFDVSEFLAEHPREGEQPLPEWMKEWGVDMAGDTPGGLVKAAPEKPARQITLLQRKPTSLGKDLGKTSGWVHRATLKSRNGNAEELQLRKN